MKFQRCRSAFTAFRPRQNLKDLNLRGHHDFLPLYLYKFKRYALPVHCNRFAIVNMSSPSRAPSSLPLRRIDTNAPVSSVREQAEAANMSTMTPCNTIDEIPRLNIKNKPYILEGLLRNKFSRNRYSWVWQYSTGVLDVENQLKPYWLCNICDEQHKITLFNADTTSNSLAHLRTYHRVYKPGVESPSEESEETSSSSAPSRTIETMFLKASKRPRSSTQDIPINLWERFKAALIAWIISYQIAFIAIENDFFKDLIRIAHAGLADMLPTGNTIRIWILDNYEARKLKVKRKLHEDARSLIHISFDLWTSSNAYAFMAVVAHYTDKDYRVQTRLLALRRLYGGHSGENQAELLADVLKDYEIIDRVGYFVTDNASNNDTAIDLLLRQISPSLTAQQRAHRRLRCWGHILNLAAKAFLFGKDPEGFDEMIITHRALAREQAELQEWRKNGPIGKLHNVVVFIRRSPQRQEFFQDFAEDGDECGDLVVVADNATRWNSVYLMVDRAIKKQTQIDRYIEYALLGTGSKRLAYEDKLTVEDWQILRETHRILEPFYKQTIRLQSRASTSNRGAAWEAYPSCDYLLKHILTERQKFSIEVNPKNSEYTAEKTQFSAERSQKHLKTSIENCWAKLDDYYQILDTLPAYIAAIVLHPGQKMAYIETKWAGHADWIAAAKMRYKKLFETLYKGKFTTPAPEQAIPSVEAYIPL